MNRPLVAAALAAAALSSAAHAAPSATVIDTSFKTPDGVRTLQESVVVNAPPATLWKALVDEATIRSSGIPLVKVDLRNGGTIEEGFSSNAKLGGRETIRHHIITYLPERLLVLQNEAVPPGLPGADLYPSIVQVMTLEPLAGGGTRFTLSHTGYGTGAGYDQLYAFFRTHNAEFLQSAKAGAEKPHSP